jgi:hypothetical protein
MMDLLYMTGTPFL